MASEEKGGRVRQRAASKLTAEDRRADAMSAAMSLREFCNRHSISLASFYVLEKKGLTPTTMRVGGRRLVSIEEAARWRAQREQQAVA